MYRRSPRTMKKMAEKVEAKGDDNDDKKKKKMAATTSTMAEKEKKKVDKKSRKMIVESDDDSDREVPPKNITKKKIVLDATNSDESDHGVDDHNFEAVKKVSDRKAKAARRKMITLDQTDSDEEDDDEEDDQIAPKKLKKIGNAKAKAKTNSKKKMLTLDQTDSEDDEEDNKIVPKKNAKKTTAKAKPGNKKMIALDQTDSDDDEEDNKIVPKKNAKKTNAKAKTNNKRMFTSDQSDSDDDDEDNKIVPKKNAKKTTAKAKPGNKKMITLDQTDSDDDDEDNKLVPKKEAKKANKKDNTKAKTNNNKQMISSFQSDSNDDDDQVDNKVVSKKNAKKVNTKAKTNNKRMISPGQSDDEDDQDHNTKKKKKKNKKVENVKAKADRKKKTAPEDDEDVDDEEAKVANRKPEQMNKVVVEGCDGEGDVIDDEMFDNIVMEGSLNTTKKDKSTPNKNKNKKSKAAKKKNKKSKAGRKKKNAKEGSSSGDETPSQAAEMSQGDEMIEDRAMGEADETNEQIGEKANDPMVRKVLNTVVRMLNHCQVLEKNKRSFGVRVLAVYEGLSPAHQRIFRIAFVQGIKNVVTFKRTSYFTKRTIKFIAIVCKMLSEHIKAEDAKVRRERTLNATQAGDESDAEGGNMTEEIGVRTVDLTMLGQSRFDRSNMTEAEFDERLHRVSNQYPCEFITKIINKCLLKWVQANDKHVQYNCTNLIQALLAEFGEIEESLYDELVKYFSGATMDATHDTLCTSIYLLTLSKLQEPKANHKAYKTIVFHLKANKQSLVRLSALKSLNIVPETQHLVFDACRDVSPAVRKYAYEKLAMYLSVDDFGEQKELLGNLLHYGATDSSAVVRRVVLQRVIPSFIARTGDKTLVKFVDALPNETKVLRSVLGGYFKMLHKHTKKGESMFTRAALDFKAKFLHDTNRLMHQTFIGRNTFTLWYYFERVAREADITLRFPRPALARSQFEDEDEYEEAVRNNFDVKSLADMLVPELSHYCQYLVHFVHYIIEAHQSIPSNKKRLSEIETDYNLLIDILGLMKIYDDAQFKMVHDALAYAMKNETFFKVVHYDVIKKMFLVLSSYWRHDPSRFIDITFDLINELNEPDDDLEMIKEADIVLEDAEKAVEDKEKEISDCIDPKQEWKLRDELRVLRDKQEEAEAKRQVLEKGQPLQMDVYPEIYMRLMYIAFSYMASLGQKEDCNRLRGLFNQIVVPAIKKESDTKLVDVAVHALHAYCRRGLEITNIFIHVFVEVLYTGYYKEARKTALLCLIDLLEHFKLENIEMVLKPKLDLSETYRGQLQLQEEDDFNRYMAERAEQSRRLSGLPPTPKPKETPAQRRARAEREYEHKKLVKTKTEVFNALTLAKNEGFEALLLNVGDNLCIMPMAPGFEPNEKDKVPNMFYYIEEDDLDIRDQMFEIYALGVAKLAVGLQITWTSYKFWPKLFPCIFFLKKLQPRQRNMIIDGVRNAAKLYYQHQRKENPTSPLVDPFAASFEAMIPPIFKHGYFTSEDEHMRSSFAALVHFVFECSRPAQNQNGMLLTSFRVLQNRDYWCPYLLEPLFKELLEFDLATNIKNLSGAYDSMYNFHRGYTRFSDSRYKRNDADVELFLKKVSDALAERRAKRKQEAAGVGGVGGSGDITAAGNSTTNETTASEVVAEVVAEEEDANSDCDEHAIAELVDDKNTDDESGEEQEEDDIELWA